eukprot:CAMPEP_0194749188 /NCGR_PEP_ID=MMETSP0323_2-20130528/3384_1 /TAXON_ID=2866 ORGANISM="Crypthecodinium cohnii, Strain Seligo" /NCGR_SAMPLE_ID=MMETSP0323_2 /ASSEMBLY_ACC=CAM_ASM_000346 /LENGTH=111 /DNA_ID=CAMNT_0039664093 /DNA_START=159 /DNA_END=495 /DNA_ORIENTATION=+
MPQIHQQNRSGGLSETEFVAVSDGWEVDLMFETVVEDEASVQPPRTAPSSDAQTFREAVTARRRRAKCSLNRWFVGPQCGITLLPGSIRESATRPGASFITTSATEEDRIF